MPFFRAVFPAALFMLATLSMPAPAGRNEPLIIRQVKMEGLEAPAYYSAPDHRFLFVGRYAPGLAAEAERIADLSQGAVSR
ncbi:hypothetical protein [Consotaella salsifontis]|nr:hypothetical protein [Consotaella salsifontis]